MSPGGSAAAQGTSGAPGGAWDPVLLSALGHAVAVGAVAAVFLVRLGGDGGGELPLPLEVLEAPRQALQPLRPAPPKPKAAEPKARQVFGISPKAVQSEQGEAVKAGNTTAKAPDALTLSPGDEGPLPVPEEEYLVSEMPRLETDVKAPYPPEARRKGIQGAVIFDLLIDQEGKVRQAVLVEGPGSGLNEAAAEAVKKLKFRPARVGEKNVAVRIRYAYRFVLEK